jgi:hypothetical protein
VVGGLKWWDLLWLGFWHGTCVVLLLGGRRCENGDGNGDGVVGCREKEMRIERAWGGDEKGRWAGAG